MRSQLVPVQLLALLGPRASSAEARRQHHNCLADGAGPHDPNLNTDSVPDGGDVKICFLSYHESQAMASWPPLKSSQQEIRAQACQLAWPEPLNDRCSPGLIPGHCSLEPQSGRALSLVSYRVLVGESPHVPACKPCMELLCH